MATLMKDHLGPNALSRIQKGLSAIEPQFDGKRFLTQAQKGLEEMELKERVNHIIQCIAQCAPCFEVMALKLQTLPKHWDYGDPADSMRKFASWPIIDYVAFAGLDYPKLAYSVLEALTPLHTAEFAIRPFIMRYPNETMQKMAEWTHHSNEHVRRLASEGCRPRLPWGMQLKEFIVDPSDLLPILETLKQDPSRYVQTSVANNLNDISKDHPQYVIDLCKRWKKDNNPHTNWIIKHGCRSLIKAGNKKCLSLFGIHEAHIQNPVIRSQSTVSQGDALPFEITLTSADTQNLVIDFAIDFLRKNNQHSRKVFKLKSMTVEKNQSITISKQHSFKAITTRQYYPGLHHLHLQVNGNIVASHSFELI